jgi:DNA-binding XRE family transcriptional regulator
VTAAEVVQLRSALGVGRAAFARAVGVSERTVRRWEENGTDANGAAVEMAEALGRWIAKPKSNPVVRALLTRSADLGALLDTLFDALTTVEYLRVR